MEIDRDANSTDNHKRLRRTGIGVSAALIAIVLFVALVVVKPAMPDRIVLLTGPEGGAYHDLGERYADDLRLRGLEAEVIVTEGVLDNMQRLAAGGNVVAFAPSTVNRRGDAGIDTSHLVTLGSVAFEPLWLFYRSGLDIVRIPDLAGKKVVTGGRGTVSDYVALALIEHNGLAGEVELQRITGQTAESLAEAFAAATIDAAFVTGEASSPVVRAMLDADGVTLVSFGRAEAYARLISGVTTLVAPEGVFDLARNVPPQDAHLLSAATCLVANDSLHRAVVPMLLIAVENDRRKTTTFSTTITFPSNEHVTLPLDSAAQRYFSQGETGLSKFLPYKVTRFLNHLGFVVLPLLTVAVVLLKIVPTGLRVWGGLRLKGLLKSLEAVEKGHAACADRSKLLADLDRIDLASAKMFVPRSTVHDYIDFRQFLHDMRERVEKKDGRGT
jgi:TRAP-type uncharacterized transport system substrate-binding protein